MENTAGAKELWGQRFNIVKKGLDETQVTAYVGDLLERYKTFAEEHEHLDSLRRLAESTVKEADKLAVEIRQNAQKEAEAEASRIIAQAREQAQKTVAEAESQAQTIISEVHVEAERIRADVKAQWKDAYSKLLVNFERLRKGMESIVEETEVEVAEPTTVKAESGDHPEALETEAETGYEEVSSEPSTASEVELTAAPFESMDELLNFREILSAPQEIQLLSMHSLEDGHGVQFQLRVSAGYRLDEHLRLNISDIIVTDHGSGKVEAQLPQAVT